MSTVFLIDDDDDDDIFPRALIASWFAGGSVIVPELRFSIRHDDISSTYTLQISKIQETDTGLYQCQVCANIRNLNGREKKSKSVDKVTTLCCNDHKDLNVDVDP